MPLAADSGYLSVKSWDPAAKDNGDTDVGSILAAILRTRSPGSLPPAPPTGRIRSDYIVSACSKLQLPHACASGHWKRWMALRWWT